MADDDLRTWAKRAAGITSREPDLSETDRIERLMDHADDEPDIGYVPYTPKHKQNEDHDDDQ